MVHYMASDDMLHEFATYAGKGYWSVICCIKSYEMLNIIVRIGAISFASSFKIVALIP